MTLRSRPSLPLLALAFVPLTLTALTAGALQAQSTRPSTRPARSAAPLPKPPVTFDEMPVPADNPMTPDKVELGWMLFFDERLSGDGTRSCYSCHLNEKGLTDGLPTAIGAYEKKLPRSSPTLWNIGWHREFYWDGRTPTMEKQVVGAWTGGNMGAKTDEIVAKLNAIPDYSSRFQKVFGSPASEDNVAKAVSAYMRTIFCADTRFDRHEAGDRKALSEAEKRGHEIFKGKAACTNCHVGGLLSDTLYHNVGIGMKAAEPDLGRGKITKNEKENGAFKTPTLRDISRTAPYFHDGSVKTLEEAVDIMAAGGIDNPWLDRENVADRKLTAAEKADLVAFLKALECPGRLEKPGRP